MKKFNVIVDMGKLSYDVEAEDEDEAIKKCTEDNNFIEDSEQIPYEFEVEEIKDEL